MVCMMYLGSHFKSFERVAYAITGRDMMGQFAAYPYRIEEKETEWLYLPLYYEDIS